MLPMVLFASCVSHLCRNAKNTIIGYAHTQVPQLVHQFPLVCVSMQPHFYVYGDWCLLGSAVLCSSNALRPFVLLNFNSREMNRTAFSGPAFSVSVWSLILGPSSIVFTRASSKDGTVS